MPITLLCVLSSVAKLELIKGVSIELFSVGVGSQWSLACDNKRVAGCRIDDAVRRDRPVWEWLKCVGVSGRWCTSPVVRVGGALSWGCDPVCIERADAQWINMLSYGFLGLMVDTA